jgi:hypothetical protein
MALPEALSWKSTPARKTFTLIPSYNQRTQPAQSNGSFAARRRDCHWLISRQAKDGIDH